MHHSFKCIALLLLTSFTQAYHLGLYHSNTPATVVVNSEPVEQNRRFVQIFYPESDAENSEHISSRKLENEGKVESYHQPYIKKDSSTNYSKKHLKTSIPRFGDTSRSERRSTSTEYDNSEKMYKVDYNGRPSSIVFDRNVGKKNFQSSGLGHSKNGQHGELNNPNRHSNYGNAQFSGSAYLRQAQNRAPHPQHHFEREVSHTKADKDGGSYPEQDGKVFQKENDKRQTGSLIGRSDYRSYSTDPRNAYSEGTISPVPPSKNSFHDHHSSFVHPKIQQPEKLSTNAYSEPYIAHSDNAPNPSSYEHDGQTNFSEDLSSTLGEQYRPVYSQSSEPPSSDGFKEYRDDQEAMLFEHNQEYQSNHEQQTATKPLSSDEDVGQEESSAEKISSKKKVEAKEDVESLASEADSNDIFEEHDGFLDMGAYTDERGSFGWYADFPVGKEHDKVTYSFS